MDPKRESREAVLFDFDGVIADSFARSWEAARSRHPHLDEATYRGAFSSNIYEADFNCTPECPPREREGFWEAYHASQTPVHLIEGMDAAVRSLSREFGLFIVSSTLTGIIESFLKQYRLMDSFRAIYGADMHASKVEKNGMLLQKYDVTPERCIFVTDTVGDIREAAHVGIASIAVPWGFQSREMLKSAAPAGIVETPAQLPGAIERYFSRA